VLLPGTYRVSSDAPVTIGGSLYSPGSTVELTRGVVSLHSAITQEVVLRTVSARGVPSYPPPTDPIYLEF
jgi:hypothetical protein